MWYMLDVFLNFCMYNFHFALSTVCVWNVIGFASIKHANDLMLFKTTGHW